MIVETVDPGVEGVEQALSGYLQKYPEYSVAISLLGEVSKAQQETLVSIKCPLTMDTETRDRRLMEGRPLVEPDTVPVDREEFLALFNRMLEIVLSAGNSELTADLVMAWPELRGDEFEETLRRVLAGEELDRGNDWGEKDRQVVANIFWESLAPFLRKCGSILASKMEQAHWQRGYCPVCGAAPLMGMFRPGDGLWLLECSLCHTWWNVPRASCPFCDGSEGSLEYLYHEQEPGQRAYYCRSCRTYVKTVDSRESDRKTLLPMEDVVTAMLDRAAQEEGLTRARGYSQPFRHLPLPSTGGEV